METKNIPVTKKILSEIDDLTADIRDDVKKAINIAAEVDVEFFQLLNPQTKAENLATVAYSFSDYSTKMHIVMDYLCKVDDTVKNLKMILAKCEPTQEDGELS